MNGIIANVVHRDLDLHFQVTKFGNAIRQNTVSASEKFSVMTLIEDDICNSQSNRTAANVVLCEFDLNDEGQTFET